jgi:hypothetical protein
MDRTLKIKGLGFSTTADDVEITVKIDGNVIFSGPVQTDKTTPYNPNYRPGGPPLTSLKPQTVGEWTESVEFAGTKSLEITATKGVFVCTQATSTHMPVAPKTDPTAIFSSGENDVPCYASETENGIIRNPYSDVTLNGVATTSEVDPGGYRMWGIEDGKSLMATLNISAGLASPTLCDGTNILATTYGTGDGADSTFIGPSYSADQFDRLRVYVNSVEADYEQFKWAVENNIRTVYFNTAPTLGTPLRIDSVQTWDPTLKTYHGFFYYNY